ncbi:TfoX/Sxy family protein [Vicingaceae bacterium]|nr:TfoX/Sxy family protein [Vicingaceae bacterium]
MAFDEYLADRIKNVFNDKRISFEARKMMGGLCFMVNDKMCCGIHIDKKTNNSLLMARIGEEAYKLELSKPECLPMDFTGKPMNGYIFVTPEGFDMEQDLTYWIKLCIDFNPLAKTSKKKKKTN